MKNIFIYLVLSILLVSLAGCGSSRTVTRTSTDTTVDLSGRWNDTDSRITAKKMIDGLLESRWISAFAKDNTRKPVVIVGTIKNSSSEHIQTKVFSKDIERELINSGEVKFVASSEERSEIRDERSEQQQYSSMETAKRLANETGADFMLRGVISTQNDSFDGQAVKFYQVDLELINLETNEKVWLDSKKIKKLVDQAGYGF
ncbi:MAG: penicillin-binding protein activator LpoB [Bacteroidetes bacterium]|nr:penicillin-binding protein activator LpoB [Bacteroidota bacterium]MBU1114435.1 penicillin-binding protein activator LpoB [Bacteroidota bacterium]MBU1800531.1 penicillin-binding protein activator LpoB [Bacteroidota bacterium]